MASGRHGAACRLGFCGLGSESDSGGSSVATVTAFYHFLILRDTDVPVIDEEAQARGGQAVLPRSQGHDPGSGSA